MHHAEYITEVLRHAAAEEAHIEALRLAISQEDDPQEMMEYAVSLVKALEKRVRRVADARQVVEAEVVVKAYALDGTLKAEGRIVAVDLLKGKVSIKSSNPGSRRKTIPFVRIQQRPESMELDEYGAWHTVQKVLRFEVVSFPPANEWLISDDI